MQWRPSQELKTTALQQQTGLTDFRIKGAVVVLAPGKHTQSALLPSLDWFACSEQDAYTSEAAQCRLRLLVGWLQRQDSLVVCSGVCSLPHS